MPISPVRKNTIPATSTAAMVLFTSMLFMRLELPDPMRAAVGRSCFAGVERA
jgi:hypothetical protein